MSALRLASASSSKTEVSKAHIIMIVGGSEELPPIIELYDEQLKRPRTNGRQAKYIDDQAILSRRNEGDLRLYKREDGKFDLTAYALQKHAFLVLFEGMTKIELMRLAVNAAAFARRFSQLDSRVRGGAE
jgi:hypothetical protein